MKKTTKKISAAALALVMGATAFTGCSGGTADKRRYNKRRCFFCREHNSYRQPEENVF